jgi:hypothetical protein
MNSFSTDPVVRIQSIQFHSGPRFSAEVWREILQRLPRRDLKAVLGVPHGISRIAARLLFRELDLHFGVLPPSDPSSPTLGHHTLDAGSKEEKEAEADLDRWHARRCADILTRIIVDGEFAGMVRTLRIFAPLKEDSIMTFQTGTPAYPYSG